MVPTGDFLAHVGDWTAPPARRAAGAAARLGPGVGRRVRRARAAEDAIADDPRRMRILASDGRSGRRCSRSCARSPATTGAAVNGYLDLVGYRLLDGFDISEPVALELPDALLRAIRIDDRRSRPRGRRRRRAHRASVRAQVPEEHRDEFDELLGEARLMYRLRDERGVYSDIWASGLMRRAALARRPAARRARADRTIPCTWSTPTSTRCARWSPAPAGRRPTSSRRAPQYRATHGQQDAPPFLGDPPQPPPDPSGLPPGIGRIMRATGIALDSLFGSSEAEHEHDMLRGLAASPGVYEGPARLVAGPSEFGRIQQGDVLLTPATTEAFNILLPLLGAIVTDNGGLLSHSAIVAREYGIPGVVGTREATERIADGTRVRVDGAAGEVTVLGVTRLATVSSRSPRRATSRVFGSKAVGLGDAIRDGLPVPPGFALAGPVVEAVAAEDEDDHRARARPRCADCATPLAVRSSAVDEDGKDASFAGQHLTLLNVPSVDDVPAALREIWWSANSDSAITYRQRVGLFTRPSVGVVVQSLLDPEARGRDVHAEPGHRCRRARDRGGWGLGEAVVAGLVIPDTYRLARDGEVIERTPGLKRIAIRCRADGGTVRRGRSTRPAEALMPRRRPARAAQPPRRHCEEVYGTARDIEWAFADGTLYLLQCRAVTTHPAVAAVDPAAAVPENDPADGARAACRCSPGLERRRSGSDRVAVQGAPVRRGRRRDPGGLRRRRVLRHRLRRGERHHPRATKSRVLGPGDHFGEIALIDEGDGSATVTATTDLVCHGLTYWEFRPLVQENGALGWKLLQTMARMLRARRGDPRLSGGPSPSLLLRKASIPEDRAPSRGRWTRRWRRPRGWRGVHGAGARRRPLSARSRSSLRALQARHDATTFSQVCCAAARARHHVVDVLGRPVAVLAAVPVAGEHGPARERHPAPVRHPHEVDEADHRRAPGRAARSEWSSAPLRATISAFSFSTSTTARRTEHDAQRLEAGVEQQRSSQASSTSSGVVYRHGSGGLDRHASGPIRARRHHSQVGDQIARVRARRPAPYWVSSRNRR